MSKRLGGVGSTVEFKLDGEPDDTPGRFGIIVEANSKRIIVSTIPDKWDIGTKFLLRPNQIVKFHDKKPDAVAVKFT